MIPGEYSVGVPLPGAEHDKLIGTIGDLVTFIPRINVGHLTYTSSLIQNLISVLRLHSVDHGVIPGYPAAPEPDLLEVKTTESDDTRQGKEHKLIQVLGELSAIAPQVDVEYLKYASSVIQIITSVLQNDRNL